MDKEMIIEFGLRREYKGKGWESFFDEKTREIIREDIVKRCDGSQKVFEALTELAKKGKEVYDKIAPKLVKKDGEIDVKFNVLYHSDVDEYIENNE